MAEGQSDPSAAQRRLAVLTGHLRAGNISLSAENCSSTDARRGNRGSAPSSGDQRAFPVKRQEELKWNGWGYLDSGFRMNENGQIEFHGKRYLIGGQELPHLRDYLEQHLGLDESMYRPPRELPNEADIAPPVLNKSFIADLTERVKDILQSSAIMDRVVHSHGHTLEEMYAMCYGKMSRYVDYVVWPSNHDDVLQIVECAAQHNVCLIPCGGATNVSGALMCPTNEKRMIVSVDMTKMNRVLWVDKENLTVHAEAGIIGQDLEHELGKLGFCTGHEPDSMELSSLGGWIATRASGMKKNVYGNIEDLVVRIRMVTPKGTMEKSCMVPRLSAGPDIHHMMMGSEGMFGIVTEATLRIRPVPQTRKYGSILFPDFTNGVGFMREIAKQRCAPASIRLVDNEQFQLGHAMKGPPGSMFTTWMDAMKKLYVTKFKGYDPQTLTGCTLLFEGTKEEVAIQEKRVYSIAAQFRGMAGGEENGRRGYLLTFLIAYIRDFGLQYLFVGDSFETSVPWPRVLSLCRNVKDCLRRECSKLNLVHPPLISCRVTQTYDCGACVYFYMAINSKGLADPVAAADTLEVAARNEILASGGSVSHHHGIGKLRKKWVTETLSSEGVAAIRALKDHIDPKNIFGANNLLPDDSTTGH
ncbi:alkyldihydroxyacetonephosphate synthase, peroxisomal-like [Sycon ciliatum]|uniref:alkyldihydroxyacetonephosphate synthase, peroxisomal-like n=1 Tax=Sycon ciliatum TaxID=27933 RepID=UPI0020A9C41E|eukprot:scpid8070/ scgid6618/ Alkyldihydroxyacetonephosphate synthase, peroxisomal; Alkylglycerone-phosphate synthase